MISLDPDPAAIPLKEVGSTNGTVGRMFAISFAATIKRDLEIASRKQGDSQQNSVTNFGNALSMETLLELSLGLGDSGGWRLTGS